MVAERPTACRPSGQEFTSVHLSASRIETWAILLRSADDGSSLELARRPRGPGTYLRGRRRPLRRSPEAWTSPLSSRGWLDVAHWQGGGSLPGVDGSGMSRCRAPQRSHTQQPRSGKASPAHATSPAPFRRWSSVLATLLRTWPRSRPGSRPTHVDEPPAHPGLPDVAASTEHIDGSMNAVERGALLDWLSEGTDGGECRVLSNVRVLSEGVDVPTLDVPRSSAWRVALDGRARRPTDGRTRRRSRNVGSEREWLSPVILVAFPSTARSLAGPQTVRRMSTCAHCRGPLVNDQQ